MPHPRPATPGHPIVAWIVVVLTVLAVWKFTEYRNQPPEVKTPVAHDK
jgi:hypothetical protein